MLLASPAKGLPRPAASLPVQPDRRQRVCRARSLLKILRWQASGFHFHDLRHTGNVLAGEAGATLRELMDRMDHSSTRAALIYQHRITQRDRMTADAMAKRAAVELKPAGTSQGQARLMAILLIPENIALAEISQMERVTGIEPTLSAWGADHQLARPIVSWPAPRHRRGRDLPRRRYGASRGHVVDRA